MTTLVLSDLARDESSQSKLALTLAALFVEAKSKTPDEYARNTTKGREPAPKGAVSK